MNNFTSSVFRVCCDVNSTMGICLIFLCLSLLTVNSVFGDEVKSVSVMEGHFVTLHTDLIKQKDDRIVWTFGTNNTLLARITKMDNGTMYSDDERFIDRLKLNDQTGDLIITHITSQHCGLYKLKIIRNNKVSYKSFNVTVYGDVKTVSMTEGHSFSLDTHFCKEKYNLMVWTYGPENTHVATLNGTANSTMFSDDERFRDRLKMNDQTGDLMIHDTTTHHSGLYTLNISCNNNVSYKRFGVTVYDDVKSLLVREGHSVILYTHVLKQGRDLMVWTHGPENTHIATIDVQANRIMFSDDERFRARVKLDDQTGDLMINDTATQHSGLYTLKIINNHNVSYKSFNLTVVTDTDVRGPLVWVIPVGLLICVCVCVCVCVYVYKQRANLKEASPALTDKGSSMNSSKTSVEVQEKTY